MENRLKLYIQVRAYTHTYIHMHLAYKRAHTRSKRRTNNERQHSYGRMPTKHLSFYRYSSFDVLFGWPFFQCVLYVCAWLATRLWVSGLAGGRVGGGCAELAARSLLRVHIHVFRFDSPCLKDLHTCRWLLIAEETGWCCTFFSMLILVFPTHFHHAFLYDSFSIYYIHIYTCT